VTTISIIRSAAASDVAAIAACVDRAYEHYTARIGSPSGPITKYEEKEMPQYIITYLGGERPSTPEEGKQHMAKYRAWLSSLGDSAVSPANPLKNTSTVNPDGTVTAGGATSMSGFTIVEVESMEAALSIAKACPFLDVGGSLEVSELMQMPGGK
jgi:hypothetical protein